MALRAREQGGILGQNNMPRKVEAKVFQGPIVHRGALGDVGNRNIVHRGLKPFKAGEVLKPSTVGLAAPRGKDLKATTNLVSLRRLPGKENVQPKQHPEVVVLEEEKGNSVMDVEEEEEVEVEELAVAFSTQRLNVKDIDAEDSNPQLVSEYVNDIYSYLRELESKNPVHQGFLEGQTITSKMRSILIDWLVQVQIRFNLLQETLYLTVAIIDRYLQAERTVPRSKLQLVGVTAMFIASKYEEIYCLEIGALSDITDKAYTKSEIRRMEMCILKKLNFNLSFPLPLHFLRRNSKAGLVDAAQHTLAKYLMELCLQEYNMCHYKPSNIAASALCLSLRLLDGRGWNDTLMYYSCYSEDQLQPVMCKMASILCKIPHSKQQAVRQKYRTNKCMKISEIPQLKSVLVSKLAAKSALT